MDEFGSELEQNEESPGKSSRACIPAKDLFICLLLVSTTIAIYARVWRCAFVNFDDIIYVTDNPHLRAGLTLGSLKWVLVSFQPDNWFPLTRLSHLVDYTLFGDQAAWHHTTSLLVHAGASLLLYGFLRSAQLDRLVAAFVAFLFAVHPLHVESVAWVSERKDVLCAFFWFAALWAWAEWTKRPSGRRYAVALGLFGLGLMSKPMIVTFPILLLLVDIWPLRRPNSLAARLSWEALREKIPFFGLSFCVSWLTWHAQRSIGAIHSLEAYGLDIRIENALITPWIYVGKTFWPASLSAIYSWPSAFPLWEPIAGGVAILGVSVLVLAFFRNRPWLAVGWFWFLVTLVPVIGLVQVGEQVRADRYMYVPMVGLSLMAAGGASASLALHPAARRPAVSLVCAILVTFSMLAWLQVRYWVDSETLFGHAVRENPRNYSAWFYLGNTLSRVPGQQPEALAAFDTAVHIKPDFVDARERLAHALCAMGRDVEGLAEFHEVLRVRPHEALANFDLGSALLKLGRVGEAVPYLREAVRVNPQYADAQMELGLALERRGMAGQAQQSSPGDADEAARHLDQAVQLDPINARAWFELGTALSRIPVRLPEAIRSFREALTLDEDYAAAHAGLGQALLKSPETTTEGIAHLEAAERLDPTSGLRQQLDRIEKASGNHK